MSATPAGPGDVPPALRKLDRSRATLVVVDVQERLYPAMCEREVLAQNVARLVRGAALLGVPVVATEQYPKGLGRTIAAIADALPGSAPRVEKTAFSCMDEPAFRRALDPARDQVILTGIEAHVCVLQSGLDLVRAGFAVHVVEDAVASRAPASRRAGLARLHAAGAVPSTTEMALFELLRGKDDPAFKDVQALVK